MKNPRPFRHVALSPLHDDGTLTVNMRRDIKTPNRIYIEFPKCALMTEQQAIDLANAIADTLEDR